MEPAVKEALDCSDQIIVVTALSLPATRRTQRLLNVLSTAQYPPGKVLVVVNRYHSDQREFLAEAEALLGVQMAGMIPNDYGTASEALDHGKPLTIMAARTTIGQWYLRGTNQLIRDKADISKTASAPEESKKTSFFGRYLPSFGLEIKGKPSVV
jgi:MinD-like ATPase involved in chromosome partitioning or flagellar assembly